MIYKVFCTFPNKKTSELCRKACPHVKYFLSNYPIDFAPESTRKPPQPPRGAGCARVLPRSRRWSSHRRSATLFFPPTPTGQPEKYRAHCGGARRAAACSAALSNGKSSLKRPPSAAASSPLWLKPRNSRRSRLKGIASSVSMPASFSHGGGLPAISAASGRSIALSPRCFHWCTICTSGAR